MELRLTVHVPRRRPRPVDLVVSAAAGTSAGSLRAALAEHLRVPVPGLLVRGRRVRDEVPVGAPPLLDGASVVVVASAGGVDAGGAGAHPRPVLELAAVGGPDAGRSLPLAPPGVDVGRSPGRGLRLDDPSLSRLHARFTVAEDGVLVEDHGSTNGVLVDGRPATGPTRVDTSSVVVIGASTLRLRRVAGPGMPLTHPGDGTVLVPTGRGGPLELPEVVVTAPTAPAAPPRARIPWVAALVPVPILVAMSFVIGPYLLAFAVIGPVVLLATALTDRVGRRRRAREEAAEHRRETVRARDRFDAALLEEGRLRHLRHPDPHEVLRRAEGRLPGLWSGGADLAVRVGLGDVPSCAQWAEGRDGSSPGTSSAVPVLVDLEEHRCLGIVGPREVAAGIAGFVLGQLATRLPPSAVGLRCLPADHPQPGWRWMDLLPHADGGGRTVLLVPDAGADGAADAVAAVVGAGGLVVALAPTEQDLPDRCGAVLTAVGGGRYRLRSAGTETVLTGDAVGPAWGDRLARALAPLREAGGARGLPRRLVTADVDDAAPLSVAGVRQRWARAAGPRAVVGADAAGPHLIDLATDGPHVLVGGTTGSGKSEFLRTLVTGLALQSPPKDLTMLLVDFKGGAAFGPCGSLPHVVGTVTDLDDHLVARVLESLEAELRRRERLLASVGASDLDDYRGRGSQPEPLPRLVVVVDELRALVDELPDLVRGLVRLAAQGRSLGIHLVLATQRPAGTLTAEVQANVNLRIAFRVRDRADSVGVVECDAAAQLPADTPGRGLTRGGDGRLTEFQVALVAPAPEGAPHVVVRSAGGPDAPTCGVDAASHQQDRAEQIAAVVGLVREAHTSHGGRPVRRPWLPPLPREVRARDCGSQDAVGLVDEPALQRQSVLRWSAASGPLWRLVGRPRSGRSSALRALVLAAARSHAPHALHVHVIGADDGLAHLRALPHVGTLTRADDARAVRALLDHLSATVGVRTPAPCGPESILLVIDGWEQLAELDDPRDPAPVSDAVLRLLRDGAGHGLVAAVSGGRDLLRSRWSALGGETFLLGAPDPLDAALLGVPSGALPRSAPPGRAVRATDTREVQFVHAPPGELAGAATGSGGGAPPWTYRPLPAVVRRQDVVPRGAPGPGLLLGVSGPTSSPLGWEPGGDGRRFLVAGPPRSGRSTALAALAASAVEAGHPVVLLDAATSGSVAHEGRPWEVLGPSDTERLVTLRRAHPDLLLLVDDADGMDDAPVFPLLREALELVDRDGGAVAVATTTSALRGRFRGLDVEAARHRCGLLLRPDRGDGDVLGTRLRAADPAAPAGRGVLVLHGRVEDVQVLAGEG